MLSVRGYGSDWKSFILAASLNGLADELCVDAGKNRLFVSQMMAGSQLWSLCQSYLFDVKGEGQFILNMEDAMIGVKHGLDSKLEYTATIDEDENKLVLKANQGQFLKLKLGDLKSHTNPKNQEMTGYIQPDPAKGNRRYRVPIQPPNKNKIPIPLPILKGHTEPGEIQFTLQTTEFVSILKKASSIQCDEVEIVMNQSRPNLFSYYIRGKDNEIETFSHIPLYDGISGDFKLKFDLDYLNRVSMHAEELLYIEAHNGGKAAPITVGFQLTNAAMPDTKRTTCMFMIAPIT